MTLAQINATLRSRQDETELALRRAEAIAYLVSEYNFRSDGTAAGPGEVDWVLRYLEPCVTKLNLALKEGLGGTGLLATAGAVLCHKRAYFKLDKPATNGKDGAEIGDLLVVITHVGTDGTWRSAQLLQFKRGQNSITRADTLTPQYVLYSALPEFSWRNPAIMGSGRRKVSSGAPQDCAKYGLIFEAEDYPFHYPWLRLETAAQVSALGGKRTALSIEMARHSVGDSGRLYDPTLHNGDWDQIVHELIKATRNKLARLWTQGVTQEEGTSIGVQQGTLSFAVGPIDFSALGGHGGTDDRYEAHEEGGAGISILSIAVRASESDL